MRVAVTGGAGFIGASLVGVLQASGHEVQVVDDLSVGRLGNLAEARSAGRIGFHRLDAGGGRLRALAERLRPDVWVHLAAGTDPVRAWNDPVAEVAATVRPGVAVLDAAAVTGARVVLTSSAAYLYPGRLAVSGADPPAPTHPFGAARAALDGYADAYAGRGLEVTTLLLGTVYGPGQPDRSPGLVARCAGAAVRGEPPAVDGDGTQVRDFVFVDDAAAAIALAVETARPGRLPVGTGKATPVLELTERFARVIGWTGSPRWRSARPGDPRGGAVDAEPARSGLGWRPRVPLDEGLRRTGAWGTSYP